MISPGEEERCPECKTEGITVVVTTMGGPTEGVIVITIVLLGAGVLLLVEATVLLVILLGGRGNNVGLDEGADVACVGVFELGIGCNCDEGDEVPVYILEAVGPNSIVVVLEERGKGADSE